MLLRALAFALTLVAACPAFAGHDEPVPGQAIAPGGRISDQSASCVHGGDSTTLTTLYYVPCVSDVVPISADGATLTLETIPAASTNLSTANATNFPASTLFDFYAFLHSGAVTYCAVPWQTSTAGASSRGTSAAVTTLLGLTVNNATPSCYNGGTTYTLTAKEATLLGSFVTTAAEDVAMQMAPAAAAGGPSGGCTLGYANLYNAQPSVCMAEDNTSSWTYGTATWEALDAGATGSGLNNRVTWVDPTGTIEIEALHVNATKTNSGGNVAEVGIGVNSTSAISGTVGVSTANATQPATALAIFAGPPPQSSGGLNYVQALQWVEASTTGTYYGSAVANGNGQAQGLSFRGTY